MGAALELHAVRKDGSELPVEVSLGPVQTEEGTLVSAAVRDITDRVQAEGELRLQAEIMRNMAEGVVLVRTSDWSIAYANPKFEEMFGYEPGELTDRPVEVVNAPTDHDPVGLAIEIQAALAADGAWSGEVHNVKKDGTTFWCYANVSNFEHPEYGVVSVAIHTDIGRWKVPDPSANHRGRGLTLIKAVMGEYTIETGNGTTIRLRKELSGER
jgi:PAS domain S-box-containing protein